MAITLGFSFDVTFLLTKYVNNIYKIAGGGVVLLYASRYHDIRTVVNVSGRYDLKEGIVERFGEDIMQRLKERGYVEIKDKNGNLMFS